jgi:triosephosphate isomerase (TIM)
MKKLIVANWKMNPETLAAARQLLLGLEHRMPMVQHTADVVVCPPHVFLAPFSHYAHLARLGTQNISWADGGAYTGEISAPQVGQWDVEYVILGHSERRIYCGETDSLVNLKIATALKHKMHPIVCLGGEEGAKKAGMKRLVSKQFAAAVKGLDRADIARIIFAYEPIWAISTMKNSKPATGDHAAELINHIRGLLAKKIGKDRAVSARVLYGGTVNKLNVHEFSKYPEISGALVGGASLDGEAFWEIVKEFSRESIHKKP